MHHHPTLSVLKLERISVLKLERISVLKLERISVLKLERISVLKLQQIRISVHKNHFRYIPQYQLFGHTIGYS